jgi:phosphinothricin acetyltransferase
MELSRSKPAASAMTPASDRLIELRSSRSDDITAVQEIYEHYVLTNTATFEEVPPDCAEMLRRRSVIVDHGLPYLVAEQDGRVLGYAYAALFRSRSAYRYTVEDSIYVHPESIGQGVGHRLLAGLIQRCQELGFQQMVAVIGDSENIASVRLHQRLGFAPAGTLKSVGFKFGRWIDAVYMQKSLEP